MGEKWPYSFNLSVVAEEIDEDPRVAFPFAQQLGATHVEFGSLWGRRVSEWSDVELQLTQDQLERLDLQVAMIGPSTFKTVLLAHVSLAEIEEDPPLPVGNGGDEADDGIGAFLRRAVGPYVLIPA